ncbi:DegT/DnrJ/EryC1/StrS family aminotransferase [Kribbella sp. NPDC023972]|uniref:DegT/DnrJ/EryC1/StrS family aminotransferase n=1 Tax=Kribbella sp. NPDC023972 TaxID=3154795 RepID=UPI0033DDFE29
MGLRSYGAESIGENFLKYSQVVVDSGQYGRYYDRDGVPRSGMVDSLEERFRQWTGRPYAVCQVSATQALVSALTAVGVAGGEVLVPAYSFVACPSAVQFAGATPVLVGSDENLTMSVTDARRLVSRNTRAIMIVHMRGRPADTAALVRLGRELGIPVIEDLSQFDGMALTGDCPDTGVSDLAVFSFQARKMLSAGEGGMVLANDDRHFKAVTQLTDSAWFLRPQYEDWPEPTGPGVVGSRMNEITAAMVLSQWDDVQRLVLRGREVAGRLRARLTAAQLDLPGVPNGTEGLTVGIRTPSVEAARGLAHVLRAEEIGVYPESSGTAETHSYPGWPSYIKDACVIDETAAGTLAGLRRTVLFQVQPEWSDDRLDSITALITGQLS